MRLMLSAVKRRRKRSFLRKRAGEKIFFFLVGHVNALICPRSELPLPSFLKILWFFDRYIKLKSTATTFTPVDVKGELPNSDQIMVAKNEAECCIQAAVGGRKKHALLEAEFLETMDNMEARKELNLFIGKCPETWQKRWCQYFSNRWPRGEKPFQIPNCNTILHITH